MRVLHFGSYWQKENDIIYAMVKDLSKVSETMIIDTHLYDQDKDIYVIDDFSNDSSHPVKWLREEKVMPLIDQFKPSIVIVNAGSMSLTVNTLSILRKMGVRTVGISLSDPDVYPYNGRIYSELYDFFYTNSKYSYENHYVKNKNIYLMPFAASTDIHKPLDVQKKHDVIIVGGHRDDRANDVKRLMERFNVGVYGGGWGKSGIKSYGNVNGTAQVEAINSGYIYISFSRTVDGFNNVKVGLFEAAACKVCIMTTDFAEVYEYFDKDDEIVTYSGTDNLIDKVSSLLKNRDTIDLITTNSYNKFLRQHTWEHRWKTVLSKAE